MKNYKFIIRKTKEMNIEIFANNHVEAMIDLMQEIVKRDKNFFTDNVKDKKDLYIKIQKIIDEKGNENLKDYADFIKENSFFLTEFESENSIKNDEDFEETIDDLPREFGEIVCEKCGNCIPIDEDLLS